MSFQFDAAAPTQGGGFTLLPAGTYDLVVIEAKETNAGGMPLKSKKGDPMVNVTCEVKNNEEYNGKKVFHNVTFLPKDKPGAGMASHFLKCINQPYEGAITVDVPAWVGEDFKAKIGPRTYTKTDGTEGKTNEIKEVFASDDVAF